MEHFNERALAGATAGLIQFGEWVTWEVTHFGVKQQLTSKITEYESPNYFVDEMVSGAFKSFKHEHVFREIKGKTVMTDKFHFQSPFGVLGKLVNFLFLNSIL